MIVRMSDFKTNEYANLIGEQQFEPKEENPMLGFRGACRYYSDRYREGFALECQAIKRVREAIGIDNVMPNIKPASRLICLLFNHATKPSEDINFLHATSNI